MIKTSRFIIVYLLLILAGLFVHLHKEIEVPLNVPLRQFPVEVRGWRMTSQAEFAENILNVLKPTDYLSREYIAGDGRTVQLYIGYHGGGKDSGEIHSPKHCLPGSGWYEAMSKRREIVVAGHPLQLVQSVYQKGDSKELFLYWFQVRSKSVSDEYSLKIAQIISSMLKRRRDASFIRVTVPVTDTLERSLNTGEKYIQDFYPEILRYLPN